MSVEQTGGRAGCEPGVCYRALLVEAYSAIRSGEEELPEGLTVALARLCAPMVVPCVRDSGGQGGVRYSDDGGSGRGEVGGAPCEIRLGG